MRPPALVAALLLAGCIDFKEITPPAPPPPQGPAEFHANLTFDDRTLSGVALGGEGGARDRRGVRISAVLDPGRDARGEPRPIRDDTLRVSGTGLAPARVDTNGTRLYEGWVPFPAAAAGGILLSLSPPAVTRGAAPPVLYQPIPVRIGSDTVDLAPGEDLLLSFSVPSPPPGFRPLEQGWMLEIWGDRTRLSLSGERLPPSPLVIPRSLLPESSGGWISARLFVNSRTGLGRRAGDGYFIEVISNASLGWTVRRSESAAPG